MDGFVIGGLSYRHLNVLNWTVLNLQTTANLIFSGLGNFSELDFRPNWTHAIENPPKVILSYNLSWLVEKTPHGVSLNSIWQLADLDRRRRITVWNELHATLTYRDSLESEKDDETRRSRRLYLGLGYSHYSASYCAGLATAIIHRVRRVRGHHFRLDSCFYLLLTPSHIGLARAEPEQGRQTENRLIPTCQRNR